MDPNQPKQPVQRSEPLDHASLSLLNTQASPQMLAATPSAAAGLPHAAERSLRVAGADLIDAACILLRLPQVASSTAQVLFQRFFFCASFTEYSVQKIASACVFLSSKLEECQRRPRDVINVFHYLNEFRRNKNPKPIDINGSKYNKLRDDMISGEMRLLDRLAFNVHVQHPHGFLVNYMQTMDLVNNHNLVQRAWNYLNDCGRTLAVVLFQPAVLAAAAISLAARDRSIALPDSPPWPIVLDATKTQIQIVMGLLHTLYTSPQPATDLPIDEPTSPEKLHSI